MNIQRMWINQPGSFQQHHQYHGMNVLALPVQPNGFCRIYFTSGPVISMLVPLTALSIGWRGE